MSRLSTPHLDGVQQYFLDRSQRNTQCWPCMSCPSETKWRYQYTAHVPARKGLRQETCSFGSLDVLSLATALQTRLARLAIPGTVTESRTSIPLSMATRTFCVSHLYIRSPTFTFPNPRRRRTRSCSTCATRSQTLSRCGHVEERRSAT